MPVAPPPWNLGLVRSPKCRNRRATEPTEPAQPSHVLAPIVAFVAQPAARPNRAAGYRRGRPSALLLLEHGLAEGAAGLSVAVLVPKRGAR